jgi:hypothetical protein
MASVPGPDPDRPLPTPGAPAQEPPREPDEDDRRVATPDREEPAWMPQPYHPERETVEPVAPAALP